MSSIVKQLISESGLTIYDHIDPKSGLFLSKRQLQDMISKELIGTSLSGVPLRTRSKIVKIKICQSLGYPVPKSFTKVQPRFVGQNFDVYTQKSNNLQIWNEEINPTRRYVFLRISENDIITSVKVIDGEEVASLDNTGTLTHKYQATMPHYKTSRLFSPVDTENVHKMIFKRGAKVPSLLNSRPNSLPSEESLMSIKEIYDRLLSLVGTNLKYIAATQERNRGSELHRAVCQKLGFSTYEDDGTYPDILNQLIEIKLQSSPTIDLGLHAPAENTPLFTDPTNNTCFSSEDIRYIIFDARVNEDQVILDRLYVVNGRAFADYFPLFNDGKINAKIQIPLPPNFFV